MGNTQSAKRATFWCPSCRKQTTATVEGRIPHHGEQARVFELPCALCGAAVRVELVRVNGTVCSVVHGDDGTDYC